VLFQLCLRVLPRSPGVAAGATGWDSESMQHYGDRIKCKIAPVHTKDRNACMSDWITFVLAPSFSRVLLPGADTLPCVI
jgi:hypothetical protein